MNPSSSDEALSLFATHCLPHAGQETILGDVTVACGGGLIREVRAREPGPPMRRPEPA